MEKGREGNACQLSTNNQSEINRKARAFLQYGDMNIYVWISQAAFHDIFDQRSTHPRSQGLFRGGGVGKRPWERGRGVHIKPKPKAYPKKKENLRVLVSGGLPFSPVSSPPPFAPLRRVSFLAIFVVQSLFTGERQFTELYYKDFPVHEIKYLFGSNGYM